MKIKTFTFNDLGVNSYLLISEQNNCILIDPSCYYPEEKEELKRFIADNGLTLKRVLNTHLHFDHALGNRFVEETYGIGAECSAPEKFLLDRMEMQAEMFGYSSVEMPQQSVLNLKDGDEITVDEITLKVLMIPGHSTGGLAFYAPKNGCLFAGDIIFCGSIGRTDLWGGDHNALISGIKEKLMTLPENTVIFCGHGHKTNVGQEKRSNPYLA